MKQEVDRILVLEASGTVADSTHFGSWEGSHRLVALVHRVVVSVWTRASLTGVSGNSRLEGKAAGTWPTV